MTAAAFLTAELDDHPESSLAKNVQRNTSILFGDRLILKLLRRSHPGVNPDAEIGRYLADRGFSSAPTLAGEISYHPRRGEASTLAVLHCYVPNRGNAWQYTLDSLRRYFDDLLAGTRSPEGHPLNVAHLLSLSEQEPAPLAVEHIGDYLETAKLLGVRTAELHLALSPEGDDANFSPEDFSALYQRSMYQTLRSRANEALYLLRRKMPDIPEAHRPLAESVLAGAAEIQKRLHALIGKKLSGQRIRCHGDYHLKQILYTGSDFQISDFEGSSAQSLQERRAKRSPLRDVAGMLRSFDYAANTILLGRVGVTRAEDVARLEPWARFWSQSVSAAFLRAYLSKAAAGSSLPKTGPELETLLGIFLMDRALDELRTELETQPQWAVILLKAITQLLDSRA